MIPITLVSWRISALSLEGRILEMRPSKEFFGMSKSLNLTGTSTPIEDNWLGNKK
jgi:hypothetical protein